MVWPALSVILLDQISKWAIIHSLSIHESVPLLSGFFNLIHIRNRGMAFGLFNRPGLDFAFYLLLGAAIGTVVLIIFWFFKHREIDRRITLGISLILGGAIGNLIDRFRFREVIDFLDFYLGPYHWPAFNVADSAITVGTLWIAINLIFQHKTSSNR